LWFGGYPGGGSAAPGGLPKLQKKHKKMDKEKSKILGLYKATLILMREVQSHCSDTEKSRIILQSLARAATEINLMIIDEIIKQKK